MPRDPEGRDLKKHTLHLFDGDFDRLRDLFPKSEPSRVVRHLVRDLIKRTEGNMNVELDGDKPEL